MPIGLSRHHRSLVSLVATLGVLVSLAIARPARADTGTAGTTGTLAQTDFFIGIQQAEGSNLAAFDLLRFFNKANCDCDTPVFLYYTLTTSGFAKRATTPTGTVTFLVGTNCDQLLLRNAQCTILKSEQIATFMALGRETLQTTARVISTNSATATTVDADGGVISTTSTGLFTPTVDCTSPTATSFTQTVWAIFDYGADNTIDFSATQAVSVDLTPPPAPANITVAPGNEALSVNWTAVDTSLNPDLQGYQVLCERGAGLQVFADNTFTSSVKSCTNKGGGLLALDPLFVCSPLLNRSSTSYRVKILQNDVWYAAAVVAIDNSGNADTPVLVGRHDLMNPDLPDLTSSYQQPQKTDSFYDVYRNGNETNGGAGQMATPGAATGGLCGVGGDHPGGHERFGLGVGALVAASLALARRRRRP
jgi:hypothetical protein